MAEDGGKPTRRWKPGHFAFAFVLGLAMLALGIWALYRAISPQDSKGRTDFTETVLHILGGLVLAAGIYFTWQTLRVNRETLQENEEANRKREEQNLELMRENERANRERERQGQEALWTDLYTRAVEQLGHDRRGVRLGGIYALERIARDADNYYQQIIDVLSAYVRENAPWPPASGEESIEEAERAPPSTREEALSSRIRPKEDIQAALNVLRRLRSMYEESESLRIDLSRADLRGAHLEGIHLENAHLYQSNLTGAHLTGARLTGAYLPEAILRGADLTGADLRGAVQFDADLTGAILTRAYLERAYLRRADLTGAHLTGAYLTKADLTGANLTEAKMLRAELTEAILTEADLTKAELTRAKMREAKLMQAILTRAFLAEAKLMQANLTEAKLEEAFLALANLSGTLLDGGALRSVREITWKQISAAVIRDEYGSVIWRDKQGDREALRRFLPDYVVVPDEPDAEPPAASADATVDVDRNAPETEHAEA
jgi:uncharacterized protein YjbI with pentapeptide repeats